MVIFLVWVMQDWALNQFSPRYVRTVSAPIATRLFLPPFSAWEQHLRPMIHEPPAEARIEVTNCDKPSGQLSTLAVQYDVFVGLRHTTAMRAERIGEYSPAGHTR